MDEAAENSENTFAYAQKGKKDKIAEKVVSYAKAGEDFWQTG